MWSLATVLVAVAWAIEALAHPFDDEVARALGAGLNLLDPRVGIVVTMALGIVGAGAALRLARHVRVPSAVHRGDGWVVWGLTICLAVAFVHGELLALLGYTPLVLTLGWFDPDLAATYFAQLTRPSGVFLIHASVGLGLWATIGVVSSRVRHGRCVDCGRDPGWTAEHEHAVRLRALRHGRSAVLVASICAMVYPVLRIPWMLGMQMGLDDESWERLQAEPDAIATGIGLGVAALFGALLMFGLLRDWGVRFPARVPLLGGKRVPVSLAVVPASAVTLALVSLGRGYLFTLAVEGAGGSWHEGTAFVAMLPWGVGLGIATVCYALRRRATCPTCGRGQPERSPSRLRVAAARPG